MPNEEGPELVADIVAAARGGDPSAALEEVALAGVPDGTDVPADDAIRDLMDRLEGWCPPGAHIEPLPPK